mmetsp:Transcript_97735/g.285275  ORF Transcript_97735/g.285275 Transcript_97735/m.285275 type:complete len:147 (+) Transcript_97735:102-542(+)
MPAKTHAAMPEGPVTTHDSGRVRETAAMAMQDRPPTPDISAASREVAVHLNNIGVSWYTATLLSMGFDNMDTLLDIGNVDMKMAGMDLGSMARLRRHLRELQKQVCEDGPYAAAARLAKTRTVPTTRRPRQPQGPPPLQAYIDRQF